MSALAADFKELSDSDYTRLRKDLLRKKGSDLQREFLGAVRDRATFVEYFDAVPTVGATNVALAPKMTESEFKDPPSDTERTLYESWETVTPAAACRSAFWAHVNLEHIRKRRINSVYLAANGGSLSGGAERIDDVLQDGTAKGPQRVDSCVRAVLLRLGGLPEVRGNRTVYVNCPFARAWWRERLVRQAAHADAEKADSIRKLIRIKQAYWEKLVDRIVTRSPTFGSTTVRSAFVKTLADFVQANPDSALAKSDGLVRWGLRASAKQGSLELRILTDAELDNLMEEIVRAA